MIPSKVKAAGSVFALWWLVWPPSQNPRPFVVRFPPGIAISDCQNYVQQVGGFGGVTARLELSRVAEGVHSIPVGLEGHQPRSLKAVFWCKGRGFATLDVPSLETSSWDATIDLPPIKTLMISGRVLAAPNGASLAGLEMTVFYHADWMCGFFNLADCGVPSFKLATARIATGGKFSFAVPDLHADPTAKRYHGFATAPGTFVIFADEVSPPFRRFSLGSASDASGRYGISSLTPASGELVLRPVVR
jgi:hypothetical protein